MQLSRHHRASEQIVLLLWLTGSPPLASVCRHTFERCWRRGVFCFFQCSLYLLFTHRLRIHSLTKKLHDTAVMILESISKARTFPSQLVTRCKELTEKYRTQSPFWFSSIGLHSIVFSFVFDVIALCFVLASVSLSVSVTVSGCLSASMSVSG